MKSPSSMSFGTRPYARSSRCARLWGDLRLAPFELDEVLVGKGCGVCRDLLEVVVVLKMLDREGQHRRDTKLTRTGNRVLRASSGCGARYP
ncbi:MAG TPA: hypothetical protein VIV60_14790 [Polyangiaceae bacterium]